MTPNDALLAVIAELRQRVALVMEMNDALTEKNAELHEECARLQGEAKA